MIRDSWRLAWLTRRNRLLASPDFQRFAARFPLTRWVARRRARALFDLVAGFTYSQALFACVTTGLLAMLAKQSATGAEIAVHIGLPLEGTDRLLKAAAALDLVERVGDHWTLGQAGAALAGNAGIAEMVAHHDALYADLADPVALLKRGGGGGALSRYWSYAELPGSGDPGAVAPYSQLMAASLPMVARQALDAYSFAAHHRMLDIGGGEGAFIAEIGARVPNLSLGLFDLPAVVERAQARLATAGLAGRTTFHAGDFTRDPVPGGYDLVTLIRILHDHDDGRVMDLLRAIRAAQAPGSSVLIVEPMAGAAGAAPIGDTYFGFYLLAMGSGRPRTPTEIRQMLAAVGFRSSRVLRTGLPIIAGAIVAET